MRGAELEQELHQLFAFAAIAFRHPAVAQVGCIGLCERRPAQDGGGGGELGMHRRDAEHEVHAPRRRRQRLQPGARGGELRRAEHAALAVEAVRAAIEEQERELPMDEAAGERALVDARAADARLELAERLPRGAKEEPPPRLVVARIGAPAFVDVVIVPGHEVRARGEYRGDLGHRPEALDVEPAVLLGKRGEQRFAILRRARPLGIALHHLVGIDLVAGVNDEVDVAVVNLLDQAPPHVVAARLVLEFVDAVAAEQRDARRK